MLEGEGLVELKPHKGAVVKPLSVKEVSELFHLRALLEGDLLLQAIPNMTEEDLECAEKALDNYDRAVASGRNIARWFKLNWLFHAAIYSPADTPIALGIVQSLHANTDRYQRIRMTLHGAAPRSHNEHLDILMACRARQSDDAVRLMRRHILEGGRQVIEFLEQVE